MSATRSFRNAARNLLLSFTGDLFRTDLEGLCDDLDVLISAAGEVDNQVLLRSELFGNLLGVGDGVGALERRNDAFEPGAEGEGLEGLLVSDAHVLGEAFILEVGVLRAGRRVVEAGGDRVCLPDLTPFRLQD